MEKYGIHLEGVAAKQAQLTAKVQEFFSSILDSEIISSLLEIGKCLMDIINWGDGLLGKMLLLTTAVIAFTMAWKAFQKSKLKTTFIDAIASIKTFVTGLWASVTAAYASAGAMGVLKAVLDSMKAHPVIFALSILTGIITAVTAATDAHNEEMQESIDKANELTNAYKSTTEELKNNLKTLQETDSKKSDGTEYKDLQEEFDALCKGVDQYGNNLSLTNEQYERYKNICADIIGMNPDLMNGYDSETEAIGKKNDALEQTIDLLETQARLEHKKYADSYSDILEGAQAEYESTTDDVKWKYADGLGLKELEEAWADVIGTPGYEFMWNMYDSGVNSDLITRTLDTKYWDDFKNNSNLKDLANNVKEHKEKAQQEYQKLINSMKSDNIHAMVSPAYNYEPIYTEEDMAAVKQQYQEYIDWIDMCVDKYNGVASGLQEAKDELANSMDDVWRSTAYSTEAYGELGSGAQGFIEGWIQNSGKFDVDEDTTEEQVKKTQQMIHNMIQRIVDSQKTVTIDDEQLVGQEIIDKLFAIKSDGTLTVKQYREYAEQLIRHIAAMFYNVAEENVSDEQMDWVGSYLGIDLDAQEDELDDLAALIAQRSGQTKEEVKKSLEQELTQEELDVVLSSKVDVAGNAKIDGVDDVKAAAQSALENIDVDTVIGDYANALNSLSEQYAILKNAQEEYNEHGDITADTMRKIIDNGLLEYLEEENGQLVFNTQKLQEKADADRDAAIASLQAALFTDLQSIALGTYQSTINSTDTTNANTQLQNFQTELENTKGKALDSATAIAALNSTLGTDYKFDTDDQKKQVDEVLNTYNEGLAKVNAMSKNLYSNFSSGRGAGSGGSKAGGSKSSKEWWETQLENLKNQLEYNEISMDTYINGIQNVLGKLKKGSDAWNKVNDELQKAKLDNVNNQFDRGEITIDQYIKKLIELRKAYKKNSEGYKELTKTINDTKANKYAAQYEREEISASTYIKRLQELQKQYKKNSEAYKELGDTINEVKLDNTEKWLDKLQKGIDDIEHKINRLGDVNTSKEQVKYADLLSDKYRKIQSNISKIQKELKKTNLTAEQRIALQEKLNELLEDEVDVRDEIEDSVREYYENQKEHLEQQAEAQKKQILYNKEIELYGKKGKELFEWETNKKIKAIEDEIELRQAERDALDEVNEREQLTNDLLQARLQLQNALNNKTTKILKKQADGTWQYEYSANMSDVKDAEDAVADAEKALDDFDFEQSIQELQDEADKLNENMENLSEQYEEAEFWAEREYEQTMNSIEAAYGNIDKLVENWMKKYGSNTDKLTSSYEKVVKSNSTLEKEIANLGVIIESKYETVGNNGKITPQSFDTGGQIVGNGLAFVHDKERVLTAAQNVDFEKLVATLPSLAKLADVTKFTNVAMNKIDTLKGKSSDTSTTTINKVECVFPNITTTDGLQKAILELPRLALQHKK